MANLAAIILRHWKPLLVFNLLVVGAVSAVHIKTPQSWTANAQLILPDTGGRLDANLGTLGSLQNAEGIFSSTQVNPLKVQSSILTSDLLLKQVLTKDPEKTDFSKLEDYKKLFKVSPEESTTVIALSVGGSSQEVVRRRALLWIEAYQQRLDELRQSNSSSRERYNQQEMKRAGRQLQQAQDQLASFKASTGLINADEQTRGIVQTLSTLTTTRAQALAAAESSKSRVRELSSRLRLDPDEGVRSLSLGENQDYQFIRQKLVELDANLVQARSRFTDASPSVQKLLDERAQLVQQVNRYIATASGNAQTDPTINATKEGRATLIQQMILAETEGAAQEKQASQLQQQITALNSRLKSFPINQSRISELQRQADVTEGVYKGLIAQVQKTRIDAFNAYPNVQVLDLPSVEAKPTNPKLSIALINILMGSLIGSAALLLLLESRNPLLSPNDLKPIKFSLVSRIPRLKQTGKLGSGIQIEPEFQRLASAISLQPIEKRRLLVTSAAGGEGKTTVTLKLAVALSDLGFRVLLVDGDFYKAELSKRLGTLQGTATTDQPVFVGPRLDLLPTQPRQEKMLDLTTRGQLEQSLKMAESTALYDYVLVDTAPMNVSSETAMMTVAAPNVVFVIRPGISDRSSVRDSLEQLTQHNAKCLALVVNGEQSEVRPYEVSKSEPIAAQPATMNGQWGEAKVRHH
jgi:polysaccharide biosynthesis transport protein